jgi:hypothetical protein
MMLLSVEAASENQAFAEDKISKGYSLRGLRFPCGLRGSEAFQ